MHWRRKWQPTPVFLPGESQGQGSHRLPSMGLHRVTHDLSDAAAAAAAAAAAESSIVLLEEGVCYDQCILIAKIY